MKPGDRRGLIADTVSRYGHQSVEMLAERFAVSPETIRRDLAHLAEAGLVQKVHGGAAPARLHVEASFRERMAENAAAKRAIAAELPALVRPGDTLFIDTGSTTLAAAGALAAIEGLTVVTNCHRIAQAFDRVGQAAIYLLGGTYRGDNAQTVGPMAIEQIGRFQADHALLTVAALEAGVGAMDADFDEAQVARAMIAHARRTLILAAAAKFGRRAAHRVCRLAEVDVLVCDELPGPELSAALERAGVTVVAGDRTGATSPDDGSDTPRAGASQINTTQDTGAAVAGTRAA